MLSRSLLPAPFAAFAFPVRALLALALLFALAAPAAAWWTPPPPDPHPGDRAHYQNDPAAPTQPRLTDCWLFAIQTWEKPSQDWTHEAAFHCARIAGHHANALPLSDQDLALEAMLLDYEGTARAWSARGLALDHIERPIDDRDVLPLALALRSGWYALHTLQTNTAAEMGLLDVLDAFH